MVVVGVGSRGVRVRLLSARQSDVPMVISEAEAFRVKGKGRNEIKVQDVVFVFI